MEAINMLRKNMLQPANFNPHDIFFLNGDKSMVQNKKRISNCVEIKKNKTQIVCCACNMTRIEA